MADITKYFTENKNTYKKQGIVVFDFDDTKAEDFITDCIIPFRNAYISDEILNRSVDNNISTREEAIGDILPTEAKIKSGEFGEILMCYLAQKFLAPAANIVPLKWRWKENRDQPSHLTDVILLKCAYANNPQTTDYIYTVEVKSAATPIKQGSPKSPINDAIEDALKDKNGRTAKTIIYLRQQYINREEIDNAKKTKRFEDGVSVTYNRFINAAIVVEKNSLPHHTDSLTEESKKTMKTENIGLFAVPLNNLKKIYENLYSRIPKEG